MKQKVSRDALYQLYIEENLSAEQIGEQFGISRTQVYRYLRSYKIERTKEGGIPSREVLYQMFVVDDLSTKEIAKQLGISRTQIYRGLVLYDIERNKVQNPNAPSRETLYQLYVEENLSAEQISEKLGFTTAGNITHYLRRYGIERDRVKRNSRVPSRETLYQLYVEENLTCEQIAEKLDYSRSRIFHFLEMHGIDPNKRAFTIDVDPPEPKEPPTRPHPGPVITGYTKTGKPRCTINEEWLRARYLDDNINTPQIAEELGVSLGAVASAMRRYSIPRKPMYVAFQDKRKRFGDFSAGLRRAIKERDHGCCQMCGTTEGSLECHHIIPSRFGGRNSLDNGILLCNLCHDTVGFHELNWAERLLALRGTKTGQGIST
jgi:transposase/5-methylcytosine-specific restriction endonuclease McrA